MAQARRRSISQGKRRNSVELNIAAEEKENDEFPADEKTDNTAVIEGTAKEKSNTTKTTPLLDSNLEKFGPLLQKQTKPSLKEWVVAKTFEPPIFVKKNRILQRNICWRRFWRPEYLLVVIIGVELAIIATIMNVGSWVSWESMLLVYERSELTLIGEYYGVLAIKLLCILMSVFITSYQPSAAGSGVPQLRAILGGIWVRKYLGLSILFVKVPATILALCSALPTGIEGPFLHISAIVARQMTKIRGFRHVDRIQMLGAACGGALGAAFGAPIGGALLSIELTRTFYPVTNYWTAFCCGIAAASVAKVASRFVSDVHFLRTYDGGTPTTFVKEGGDTYQLVELIFSLMLGLICGMVGLLLVKFSAWFVRFRRKYQTKYLGSHPYGITLVVVIFFSTIQFFIGYFSFGPSRGAVSDLFLKKNLAHCENLVFKGATRPDCFFNDWTSRNVIYNLFLSSTTYFFFTATLQTLPFPAGIVGPSLNLGVLVGRMVGEILHITLHSSSVATPDPRVYAVIGTAAMMASITKTISSAVIMMEITKETTLLPPMLLAVLMSCGVVGALGESFFDSAMRLRGIPMLPVLPGEMYKLVSANDASRSESVLRRTEPSVHAVESQSSALTYRRDNGREEEKEEAKQPQPQPQPQPQQLVFQMRTAADIMQKTPFVTIRPEPLELAQLLIEYSLEWFPVVHSKEEQVLVGEISRQMLMQYLETMAPKVFQKEIPLTMHEDRVLFPPKRRRRASRQLDLTAPSGDSMLTPFHATNVDVVVRRGSDVTKLGLEDMPTSPNENTMLPPLTPKVGSLLEGIFLEQLNFTPFQVTSGMVIPRVYTLFHVLRLANVYVIHQSKLVGIITEEHLLEMEKEYREKQDTELWRFCTFRG